MKLFIFSGEYTDLSLVESINSSLQKAGHILCDNAEDAEMIVSLGGDGTLLKAAQLAIVHDKVLTGVNCGRVGYLCLLKQEEIEDFDSHVENGIVSVKTLLSCPAGGREHLALNDIVVGKTNQGLLTWTCWLTVSTGTTYAVTVSSSAPLRDHRPTTCLLPVLCWRMIPVYSESPPSVLKPKAYIRWWFQTTKALPFP